METGLGLSKEERCKHGYLLGQCYTCRPKQPKQPVYDGPQVKWHEPDPLDLDLSNLKVCRTLGFLASHGKIRGSFPPEHEDSVRKSYEKHTGDTLSKGKLFCILYVDGEPSVGKKRRRGPSLGIYVDQNLPPFELFLSDDEELHIRTDDENENSITIELNKLILKLFDLGFRKGEEHDVDAILEKLPNQECRDAFIFGYRFKKGFFK
jgi:hypothetical protein